MMTPTGERAQICAIVRAEPGFLQRRAYCRHYGRVGSLHNLRPALSEPDASLIEACRQGDRRALERVLLAHSPYLERLLGRVAGSLEVEDLLQMTFMAAIRAFPGFRGEAQVRTWLARIAVRIAQERLHRPERKRRVPWEHMSEPEPRATTPGADHALDDKQRLARLRHHLDAIAPKKRVAFVLHVFEGHPIDEVAALTGASVPAVKSRVFWARRELLKRASRDPWLREYVNEEQVP
ncbi:MAG TPA: RNA polymerase sigma factor [Polyangiales bacterium]